MNMNATQVLAVSKSLKDAAVKAASEQLPVGVHSVDFLVRIRGSLTKGEDVFKAPTCRTPWLAALALFIKRSVFQREKALADLMACIREAILMDESAAEALYEEVGIKQIEDALKAEYAKLPKIRAAGAVRTALNLEIQQ